MTILAERPGRDDAEQPVRVAGPAPPRRPPAAAALVAVLALALLLAVTGITAPDGSPSASLARTSDGDILLVDFDAAETAVTIPDAVAAADGSVVYRALIEDQETTIEEIEPASAEVASRRTIRGRLDLRVVSPRGGAVALVPRSVGGSVYEPRGRDATDVTVVRAHGTGGSRTYALDGNYEPEAFSLDESRLFLIEYWPPEQPDRYFVRQLMLDTGEVADVFSPEVGLEPEMRGRARGQVVSPDGDFLYTLYALENGMPSLHDHHAGGETRAFIHVLSLTEDWSHCIFIEMPFAAGGGDAYGLALSPNGKWLAALDRMTGRLAVISTDDHVAASVESPEIWRPDGRVADVPLALSDDATVYLGQEGLITEINPWTLQATAYYAAPNRIRALEVTTDGRYLRVAAGHRLMLLDRDTRAEVTTMTVTGTVAEFGPASGHLTEVDLTCAC